MSHPAPKVYLDACVAIYFVEQHPMYFPVLLRRMAVAAPAVAPVMVVSELCRLECRIKPLRERDAPLLDRFERFFAIADLQWAALDRAVFDVATHLRAEHGLKTPDALHLAAALEPIRDFVCEA
ncbi:PIN domain-containing protein [Sphaerotilus sp.]|uniref:type II toxin-antitoxin system VapC family toxin n=1 Tax=Sphaerotilus sp. TaxID=2093942 RepID=UPI00286DFDDA|nr:PIN domain-containing protein [Sphaerotilus sp.]